MSNNAENQLTKPIKTARDRKKEVNRLETALERLLINLGSDVDPHRYKKEEVSEIIPEPPAQVYVQDNKYQNTMVSQITETERVATPPPEKMMDSYVSVLRNGYLGVCSGTMSPMELELDAEEEVEIVKPKTFDPEHAGIVNLSPNQLSRIRKLAGKRDNEQPMTLDEDSELDYLLDQLENGVPIDTDHPGMVNLTPE